MKNVYQEITELVSENRLDDAIAKLNSICNSQDVALITSQYNELKKSNLNGTLHRDDYNVEFNRIRLNILHLAEQNSNRTNDEEIISEPINKEGTIKVYKKNRYGEEVEVCTETHWTLAKKKDLLKGYKQYYTKEELVESPINVNNPLILIMKGGGIKGLAYAGALEVLEKHLKFNWFVGTSAGAISAVFLGSGMNSSEIFKILSKKRFTDFKDTNFPRNLFNLLFKGGLYEGNSFTNWLQKVLAEKLKSPVSVKLKDLPLKTTVYASTSGRKGLRFDSFREKTSDYDAAYAARCSMAIPFFFTPQRFNGEDVFDGGIQNNYPVDIFLNEENEENFIGLYLGSKIYEGKNSKKNIVSKLLNIWTEAVDEEALRKYKDNTIIIDPRPIKTKDFNISQEKIKFLYESGKIAAEQFLIKNQIIIYSNEQLENLTERDNKCKELQQKFIIQDSKKKKKKILLAIFILLLPLFFLLIFKMFSVDNFDGTKAYDELGRFSKIKQNMPIAGIINAEKTFSYAWMIKPDTLITTIDFTPKENEALYFKYSDTYNEKTSDSIKIDNTPILEDSYNHFRLYKLEENIDGLEFKMNNLYSNEPTNLKSGSELYVVYSDFNTKVRITKGRASMLKIDYNKYSNYFNFGTKCFVQGAPIFNSKTNKIVGMSYACSDTDGHSAGVKINNILSAIYPPHFSEDSTELKQKSTINTFEFYNDKILLNEEIECLPFYRNFEKNNYVIFDVDNKQLISGEINSIDGNEQTVIKTNDSKEIVIDRRFSLFELVGNLINYEVINIDCDINYLNFKKMIEELN